MWNLHKGMMDFVRYQTHMSKDGRRQINGRDHVNHLCYNDKDIYDKKTLIPVATTITSYDK